MAQNQDSQFEKELNRILSDSMVSNQLETGSDGLTQTAASSMTLNQTDAMAQWLAGREWTFFFTFTTRYSASLKATRRVMDRSWTRWKNSSDGSLTTFWVAEKHKHRGFHVHGLLDWSGLSARSGSRNELRHAWTDCVDGFQKAAGKVNSDHGVDGWHRNKVELCDNNDSYTAVRYCAKYLTKELSDWDVYFS